MWGQATPKTPAVGFDLNRLSVGAIELGYDWQMVAEAFVKDHVLITDPSSLQTVAKRSRYVKEIKLVLERRIFLRGTPSRNWAAVKIQQQTSACVHPTQS